MTTLSQSVSRLVSIVVAEMIKTREVMTTELSSVLAKITRTVRAQLSIASGKVGNVPVDNTNPTSLLFITLFTPRHLKQDCSIPQIASSETAEAFNTSKVAFGPCQRSRERQHP